MLKNLFFICTACVLFFTSCSENSNSPIDLANGINVNFAGELNYKYSSNTATAITATVEDKTALTLTATTTISDKEVTIIITVFGTSKGIYELSLENIDDPEVMCVVNNGSDETYISNSGSLTITEIGTSLASKVKGTFNFHLYDTSLDKELNLTSGTFNLIHVVY